MLDSAVSRDQEFSFKKEFMMNSLLEQFKQRKKQKLVILSTLK